MRSGGGGGPAEGGAEAAESLATLYQRQPLPPLPEYLPQDNDEDGGAGGSAGAGVLRLQAKALKALLALRRPAAFVRCVRACFGLRARPIASHHTP